MVLLGAALALAGCGKADLSTTTGASAPPAKTATVAKEPAPRTPAAPVPLPLTAARAAAFAKAVELTGADVPGAHPARRSKTPLAREREAAQCGGRTAPAVGGARSPELQRGGALERESISSAVEVLRDAKSVERDLAYAQTAAGLRCYERVLSRSLRAEADPNIRMLRRTRRAAVGHGGGRGPRQGHQDPRSRRRPGGRGCPAAVRRRGLPALRPGGDQPVRRPASCSRSPSAPSRSCSRCCTTARASTPSRARDGCAARRGRPCLRARSPGHRPACPSAPSPRVPRSPRSVRPARRRG